jgi:hypothetical protein
MKKIQGICFQPCINTDRGDKTKRRKSTGTDKGNKGKSKSEYYYGELRWLFCSQSG